MRKPLKKRRIRSFDQLKTEDGINEPDPDPETSASVDKRSQTMNPPTASADPGAEGSSSNDDRRRQTPTRRPSEFRLSDQSAALLRGSQRKRAPITTCIAEFPLQPLRRSLRKKKPVTTRADETSGKRPTHSLNPVSASDSESDSGQETALQTPEVRDFEVRCEQCQKVILRRSMRRHMRDRHNNPDWVAAHHRQELASEEGLGIREELRRVRENEYRLKGQLARSEAELQHL